MVEQLQIGVAEEGLDISIHDILMEEYMLPFVDGDMRLVASRMIGLLSRRKNRSEFGLLPYTITRRQMFVQGMLTPKVH